MISSHGRDQGDWFLQYLRDAGIEARLGLVSLGWGLQHALEPLYPSNAYADCPRLDLYLDEQQVGPWMSGLSVTDAAYSLYYKRRHDGQGDYQRRLADDVDAILSLFLGHWQPVELSGHPGVKIYGAYPNAPTRYHDVMRHEFDDPALRVSVAEIPIIIRSRSHDA